ncbi:unnamed protein product, partial [Rotaria sp. Silwood1]
QVSLSSGQSFSSTNQQNKTTTGKFDSQNSSNMMQESIDYVPPELSADHHDSDVCQV